MVQFLIFLYEVEFAHPSLIFKRERRQCQNRKRIDGERVPRECASSRMGPRLESEESERQQTSENRAKKAQMEISLRENFTLGHMGPGDKLPLSFAFGQWDLLFSWSIVRNTNFLELNKPTEWYFLRRIATPHRNARSGKKAYGKYALTI